jgi:hypothetical protein
VRALKGKVFEQERRTGSLPSASKYHISKESVKEFFGKQIDRTACEC